MPQLQPFQDELPIPDLVRPSSNGAGQHVLSLVARARRVRLHQSLPETRVWSYQLEKGTGKIVRAGSGNSYLGPTIESLRKHEVSVAWKNEIPTSSKLPFEVIKVSYLESSPTPVPENEPGRNGALSDIEDPHRAKLRSLQATLVTHLHGARVPADFDGWPDNTTLSGHATHYTYPNDQAATMLWYHDHCMHVTRLNVYAGLVGVWLVRDPHEKSLQLPDKAREIPLVIQDRNLDLDEQGEFSGALLHKTEVNEGPAEFFGPYTLVNGKIWPKATVAPRLYRLRLLNGSNARTYRLHFLNDVGESQNLNCWQIGCDQGLMPQKVALPDSGLVMAPAERMDLLVDFAAFAGKQVYLWNTAEAPFSEDANQPSTQDVKDELSALQNDPLASAGTLNDANAINRRLFPQVMRFDVASAARGASSPVPPDPLTPARNSNVTANTPVRFMGLVEVPADSSATAPKDATSMLVFYEFLPDTPTTPAPPGALVVTIKYWHPGRQAFETGQFWKAAQQFYDQINWFVHLNSTELWYIVNLSPDTHPIHVHLVDMSEVIRYDFNWDKGKEVFDPTTDTLTQITTVPFSTTQVPKDPNPDTSGPKDTVRVNPGEMVSVAMTFSPFPGRYMYHCHILEHEDHDMMRPFVVVPDWVPHHDE